MAHFFAFQVLTFWGPFARKMVALGYYTHNNVSIGYCAETAGFTEEEFIAFLGQNKIDIFQFGDDAELMRDIANA